MGMNPIQQAAADLRARGFGIVFLKPGEKTPHRRGWTLVSQEPTDYRDNDNLGILTGRLSGDLVVVDLDSAEALALADEFLPPTSMIDGRAGKPRSHRYYRVADIPPAELSDKGPGGGPKTRRMHPHLDLLGTGSQCAAPPSLHASGEHREWSAAGDPATVPYAALRAAVDALLTALSPPKRPPGRPRKAAALIPAHPNPPSQEVGPVDLARVYLARHAPAISGQGGRARTWNTARLLVCDFALSVADALPLLLEWNTRCLPPWNEGELHRTLERAGAAPSDPLHPRGCKLRPAAKGDLLDPARLAREFLDAQTWRLLGNSYWRYTGTHYEEGGEVDISGALTLFIQDAIDRFYSWVLEQWENSTDPNKGDPPRKPHATTRLVANVLAVLNPLIKLPARTRLISMIGVSPSPDLLAVQNGLLDLATDELLPHTPLWFSPCCLPVEYDRTATCPLWHDTVNTLLEGDTARLSLLQEWFGYCLHAGFEPQKFKILCGGGGTGKSTVLAALKALMGDGVFSTTPLYDIGTNRFALVQTLGKMVNICSDTSEIERFAEGPLKSFVTGEEMTFEHKGKPQFTARPTAKLIIATNVLPYFPDKTDGIWRRALHLPMTYAIHKDEHVPGMDRTEHWQGELPGMLAWAVVGLRRLREAGWQFTISEVSIEVAQEHRNECDNARRFLSEHYTADPSADPLPKATIYTAFRNWCGAEGITRIPKHSVFNVSVRQLFRGVREPKNGVRVNGQLAKVWVGIRPVPIPAVT